ncbi:MAG TPA: hypothetical protein VN442_21095 [Bryobacteraceae bacterium]|nr:hypothetical protein [Bryobacteraceae bacterium]
MDFSRRDIAGTVAAGTIAAKSALASARVLADSFRQYHPDIPFYVLLADEVDGCFDPARESFRLVRLAELPIPAFDRFRFHYTPQELSYAATPYLLTWLLDQGFDAAIFLKQESLVMGDMAPVLVELERHPVLLTPHLLEPPETGDPVARELNILLSGVYNNGFAAFVGTAEARCFLAWWQERLWSHCVRDVAAGMHFEQRWLDFAPAFVDNVGIVRDSGMNVAHWNLPERSAANVRLFRFSGFDPEHPERATRYSPRLTMANLGPAAEAYRWYLSLLEAAGWQETRSWPYSYGCFDNGEPIPDVARSILREMGGDAECFGNPFCTSTRGSYFGWLHEPVAKGVPRLWHLVHGTRPDLQRVFPDPLGKHRRKFVRWIAQHGRREYGLDE